MFFKNHIHLIFKIHALTIHDHNQTLHDLVLVVAVYIIQIVDSIEHDDLIEGVCGFGDDEHTCLICFSIL